MTETEDDSAPNEPRRMEIEIAKTRIEQQFTTLENFSRDGHKTLRISLVLAGLFITSIGYLQGIPMSFVENDS